VFALALAQAGCVDEYADEVLGCYPGGDCFFEQAEWKQIQTLSLGEAEPMGPVPQSIENAFADDVHAKDLGRVLFFDTELGPHGASCATCHEPNAWFSSLRTRREPGSEDFRGITSVVDSAYYGWHAWHGRKEHLWQLAQVPIEKASLLDGNRVEVVHHVYDAWYGEYFRDVFGLGTVDLSDIPTEGNPGKPMALEEDSTPGDWEAFTCDQRARVNAVFKSVGSALEAYMRSMVSGPTPFDAYVAGDFEAIDDAAKRGLRLFIRKANCIACHSGPKFTDNGFHNIGLPLAPELSDRKSAIEELRMEAERAKECDPDASPPDLEPTDELRGALRTPSLRNVAMTRPYMHTGSYGTLQEVLWHYDTAHAAAVGDLDWRIWPLELTDAEIEDLVAFLRTLTSTSCPWVDDGVCPSAM
jgi:cytochrome c peroxidase